LRQTSGGLAGGVGAGVGAGLAAGAGVGAGKSSQPSPAYSATSLPLAEQWVSLLEKGKENVPNIESINKAIFDKPNAALIAPYKKELDKRIAESKNNQSVLSQLEPVKAEMDKAIEAKKLRK